ncbi:fumarylacetoacetate hydrolase family protein [Thorsellia kenyensis]|uniref:Fumarylacetoacetate hydrolase family protein n=1 Tax=Thorsellia kenyensis TaxID=1549888 RepID=A0ABV6CAP7_9GAMM
MPTLELNGKTVFGVALNYQKVLAEHAHSFTQKPYIHLPKKPVLFIKTPNTYNFTNHVEKPKDCRLQPGATLAVVIGKTASRVSIGDALTYVKGVCVGNEFSLPEESFYRPAIKAKCRDGFMAFDTKVVPLEHISNLNGLSITVSLNGEIKQEANTNEWVRDIALLIAEITEYMTLYEGDVLLTGTPAGRFDVEQGDEVTVSIEKVGNLTTKVI